MPLSKLHRTAYALVLGILLALPPAGRITSLASASHLLQTPEQQAAADITLFRFSPALLEVPLGTTITWTNHDAIEHSVTEGSPAAPPAFDSGFFTQDQSWSFTFTQPGPFHYYCQRHPFMQGDLIVTP